MKVLLIYPNWQDPLYSTLPIGLASIAALLLKNSFEVDVLDCSALNLGIEGIRDKIKSSQPDLVGISAMTPMIFESYKIAEAVKNGCNAQVAIGGVHPSLCPEEVVENEFVDYAIVGEGEYVFLDLCKAIRDKKGFDGIKGVYYLEEGKPKYNGVCELTENLDDLPFPAVDLFPLDKYHQSIGETSKFMTMITSRGCPYMCTYCVNSSNALFGKKYRTMSAERVVSEIQFYVEKYGVTEIDFYDDNFTSDVKRLVKFCDLLQQKGIKIKWKCSSRVETIDEGILRKMKDAGCYLIAYGVESGDRDILNSVKRFTSFEKVEEVFSLTHKVGIRTVAYFMIGFPDETKETIKRTVDFAIKIDPTYVQFSLITPYPHTQMFTDYLDQGLLLEKDWSKYNYIGESASPIIKTKYLSSSELHEEYRKAIKRFYFRPKYIVKQIGQNLSYKGMKKSVKGLFQILKWIK